MARKKKTQNISEDVTHFPCPGAVRNSYPLVNIREKPETSSSPKFYLKAGQLVTILNIVHPDWYYVEYKSVCDTVGRGYVMKKCIREV